MTNPISTTKIEEIAATELINFVNKIDSANHDIKTGEKGISWDGVIKLYKNNDIDKKDNFLADVDVQVKGRTVYKKNKGDSISYPVNITDLKNYLKKNGTVFFVGTINVNEENECTLYCKPLLRVELYKLLQEKSKNETINIKLKKITSASELERILYNFNTDKEIQSKISDKVLNNPTKFINSRDKTLTFYEFGKTNPDNLIGEEKYVYQKDENDNVVGVFNVKLQDVVINNNVTISTLNHKIEYNDATYKKNTKEETVYFGESFQIPLHKQILNINIKGSLNERINDLEFLLQIMKDGKYLIDESESTINATKEDIEKFKTLLDKYRRIKKFLESKNIKKDIKLDEWKDDEIEKLFLIIRSIEDQIKLHVEEWNSSMMCAYKINELILSIVATRQKDGTYIFYSFFNSPFDMSFTMEFTDGKMVAIDNKFLGMDRYLYTCDDMNVEEIKESIKNMDIKEDEVDVINRQILEMIFAYDETKNNRLLDLANDYLSLIEGKIDNRIYILNKYQIKKRLSGLSSEEEKEISEIKNNSEDEFIIIGCSILLDSKKEALIAINKLSQSTKESLYKEFPIMNLLKR